MYKVKIAIGGDIHIDDILRAEGFEHKSLSPDCGDISVYTLKGLSFCLAGKDCIPWDKMDDIIDFINEIAVESTLDIEIPDVAKPYVYRIDDNSELSTKKREEIVHVIDRLNGEFQHVLDAFDWTEFPNIDRDELLVTVQHKDILNETWGQVSNE